jgi:hypothetical protein
MKLGLALAAGMLLLAAPAPAQDAIAEQKAAMKKFDWMKGRWRGPAVAQTAEGELKLTQTERIGPMLDGTLLVMEGKGFGADGSAVFNAFGVLSFDSQSKAYTLRSHAQGYAGTFKLVPSDTGYIWEVPAGAFSIRYTASFRDGTWTEVGDRIVTGQPPQRIFEMNLRRVGDSDWPEAGAQKP